MRRRRIKHTKKEEAMAINLNKKAVQQAERLIPAGEIAAHNNNWQEEKPTPEELNAYLKAHSMEEYGSWFLGINPQVPAHVKEHYDYPYGDFKDVQRAALLFSIEKAQKAGHAEIAGVAKKLLELVDKQLKGNK